MNNDITEKLKKLLRLGTSDNENESQRAMERAQALAIEHKIDLAMLNVWEDKEVEEQYIKSDINCGRRLPVCQRFVNLILQNYFNVTTLYSGNRYWGRSIILVGKTSDIEFAKYVSEYLNETFMRLWHDYKKRNNAPASLRSSYLTGLYRGLSNTLYENQIQAKANKINSIKELEGEEKATQVSTNYDLAVCDERVKMAEAVNNFFPKLGKSYKPARTQKFASVISDGYAVGKTIKISKAITGSSQKALACS